MADKVWNIYVLHQFKLSHPYLQNHEKLRIYCNCPKIAHQKLQVIYMNVPENTDTIVDFVRINGGKKLSGWLSGLIAPCATHFFQQKHCFHKVSIICLFTYFRAHVCPFSLAYYRTRESCLQALLSPFLLEKTLSRQAVEQANP